jgi:hypothetical protein
MTCNLHLVHQSVQYVFEGTHSKREKKQNTGNHFEKQEYYIHIPTDKRDNMCDHFEVTFRCGHMRILVNAWCTKYASTHKPCPANIIAR